MSDLNNIYGHYLAQEGVRPDPEDRKIPEGPKEISQAEIVAIRARADAQLPPRGLVCTQKTDHRNAERMRERLDDDKLKAVRELKSRLNTNPNTLN